MPQLVIRLNREKLARFGISVNHVAEIIETALNGIEATDVYEADRVTSVLIRLPEKYRNDEEGIKNLLVDTPGGERIPLSELAYISYGEGPQTIFRENMMRRKIILCNVVKRDVGSFVEEAQQRIAQEVSLPSGYFGSSPRVRNSTGPWRSFILEAFSLPSSCGCSLSLSFMRR